jgi:hypothetical protein
VAEFACCEGLERILEYGEAHRAFIGKIMHELSHAVDTPILTQIESRAGKAVAQPVNMIESNQLGMVVKLVYGFSEAWDREHLMENTVEERGLQTPLLDQGHGDKGVHVVVSWDPTIKAYRRREVLVRRHPLPKTIGNSGWSWIWDGYCPSFMTLRSYLEAGNKRSHRLRMIEANWGSEERLRPTERGVWVKDRYLGGEMKLWMRLI